MTTDDYAGHPESVTEIRANKATDGSRWTPRDALIRVLRDIDDGKIDPDRLIVGWQSYEGDDKKSVFTGFSQSSEGSTMLLGLIESIKYEVLIA